MTGPLEGIRVLDVTRVWAGPMASAILADLGADVIRVELPGRPDGEVPPLLPGTDESWFRQSVNRNKRSVLADLRTGDGRDFFLELVATADLVVENFRPGTLDGWSVGYDACRAAREDIVLVSISGFGPGSPGASGDPSGAGGYDPIIQAYAGWMALHANPDGQPRRTPTFVADDLVALQAAIAALAALQHRHRTGEGQHVEVAMLDSLLAATSGLLTREVHGIPATRLGNDTDFVVPSNCYPCRDGSLYLVAALNRQWRRLAELIGRPEAGRHPDFAGALARIERRDAVDAMISDWTRTRSTTDAVAALTAAGVPAAPVRTLAEVAADPSLVERGVLQSVTLDEGQPIWLTGSPAHFSATPVRLRTPAPRPGEHTAAVRAALDQEKSPSPRP